MMILIVPKSSIAIRKLRFNNGHDSDPRNLAWYFVSNVE